MSSSGRRGLDDLVARHGAGTKVTERGTHRTALPADTVAWTRGYFERLGITRVAVTTGLDSLGIPVVMVVRPNSRSLAVTQGKGLTLDAAKASGIMESIEFWHGEHHSGPFHRASITGLGGGHQLLRFDRMSRRLGGDADPSRQILWTVGIDLVTGSEVFVPEELVGADNGCPTIPGLGCFPTTTNGLASGNHALEAILHGLCEVIERDATAIAELGGDSQRAERRLDLGTVPDTDCREVVNRIRAAGSDVAVWDATTDVGVPSFDCILFDRFADPWRPVPLSAGNGCHPDPSVALLRALTEAAQSRLTVIAGSRDDMGYGTYEEAVAPELRSLADTLTNQACPRSFDAPSRVASGTIADDLTLLVERLMAVGLDQVVAVDLTRSDLEIPVWRVIVPGLEDMGVEPHRYQPGPRGRRALRSDSIQSSTGGRPDPPSAVPSRRSVHS